MPESEEVELQQIARGRPIWSGTVSFGLVSVPVTIMPANRPSPVSFHMVSETGEQLRRRYFVQHDDEKAKKAGKGGKHARRGAKTRDDASARKAHAHPLTDDEIVRGYEYKKGKFVILEDDELERIAPESTRDIDLRVFVDAKEIDPTYFVRAYYLVPIGSTKAYKLLARVMEERGRAGVATFVMRAKEYVAAILADNGVLRLETLRFADEIRSPKDVGLPEPERPRPAEVKKIESLIKRYTKTSLDKRLLEDPSAEKLEALAKRKAKEGEDVVRIEATKDGEEGEEAPAADVLDLMERLQRSLRADHGKSARAVKHRRTPRRKRARAS